MAVLKKIKITEISAVDFPAQKDARVVLMKRNSSRDETADVGQKYGIRGMVDFRKMVDDEDLVALQKFIDSGEFDFTKAEIHEVLEKRADELRVDGETLQQSYATLITADPAGRTLFKAYHRAPLGKVKAPADARQDDIPHSDILHIGPEHARLYSQATHEMQKRPGLSRRQAVANLLERNASFSERIKRERLDHEMKTLSI